MTERALLSADELRKKAGEIRRDPIEMVWRAGNGHIGGSLSLVDIAVALYYRILNIDSGRPCWEDRDRVVLSKGHARACLYAILADLGDFERSRLWDEFIRTEGRLPEHPSMRDVTAENHSVIGGLGSDVAEVLAERCPARLKRVGIQDRFGTSGTLDTILERCGLTAENIVRQARILLGA
jgi:transketolase